MQQRLTSPSFVLNTDILLRQTGSMVDNSKGTGGMTRDNKRFRVSAQDCLYFLLHVLRSAHQQYFRPCSLCHTVSQSFKSLSLHSLILSITYPIAGPLPQGRLDVRRCMDANAAEPSREPVTGNRLLAELVYQHATRQCTVSAPTLCS